MTLTGGIDLGRLGRQCLDFVQEWLRRGDEFFDANQKSSTRDRHPATHVLFPDLMNDSIGTVKKIYRDLGLSFTPEYEHILQERILMDKGKRTVQEARNHWPNQSYPTGYSLEEYGLSEADLRNKLGWYVRKYLHQ